MEIVVDVNVLLIFIKRGNPFEVFASNFYLINLNLLRQVLTELEKHKEKIFKISDCQEKYLIIL